MAKIIVSLAQMQIVPGRPQKNFDLAKEWIREAVNRGSSLIVLPELWSTSYDLKNCSKYAPQNARLLDLLSALAKEYKIWIAGSMILEKHRKFTNTLTVHSEQGNIGSEYSKVHLFRLMDEHHWLSPGDHLQIASLPIGKTGLAICYDLRFPEVFRQYALLGATLILLPAEWPLSRVDHWKTLLRARAIENQMYIIATNCVGQTEKEIYGGCSAIINPWGETVIEGTSRDPALLTAEIDLDQVTTVRQTIPVFQDRRPDLYVVKNHPE